MLASQGNADQTEGSLLKGKKWQLLARINRMRTNAPHKCGSPVLSATELPRRQREGKRGTPTQHGLLVCKGLAFPGLRRPGGHFLSPFISFQSTCILQSSRSQLDSLWRAMLKETRSGKINRSSRPAPPPQWPGVRAAGRSAAVHVRRRRPAPVNNGSMTWRQ